MPKQAFQPEGMASPKPPYSPVVVSGDMVWTAGQTGVNGRRAAGRRRHHRTDPAVLENVRTCLAAAGCTLNDVVKVNTYIADLGDIAAYNEVYREFFSEPYPARSSVCAALPAGTLIEIEAVARRL